MLCPSYKEQREKLLNNMCNIIPSLKNMSELNKFKYIMQTRDYDISKICVNSISNMYNERLNYTCPKQALL